MVLSVPIIALAVFLGFFVNSYAYETNTYSQTLTRDTSVTNYFRYEVNEPFTPENQYGSDYTLLINVSSDAILGLVKYSINNVVPTGTNVTSTWFYTFDNKGYIVIPFTPDNSNTLTNYINVYSTASNFDILNIDIVKTTEVTTMYYLDTYVEGYQQQLAQLQNQYDSLVLDYQQKESDLQELQTEYDTLENNYDSLRENYDTLVNVFPFESQNISSGTINVNGLNYIYSDYDYLFKLDQNSVTFNTRDLDESTFNLFHDDNRNIFIFTFNFNRVYNINSYICSLNLLHSREDEVRTEFYKNGVIVDNTLWVPESDSINDSRIGAISFDSVVITLDLDYDTLLDNRLISLVLKNDYKSGFSDGYTIGYGEAERDLWDDYQQNLSESYQNGYSIGYNKGYDDGFNIGSDENGALSNVVISIVEAPINIFKDIFDFKILGLNLSELVLSIITLIVTIFLIKKFMR